MAERRGRSTAALRVVAAFEALKGAIVLAAGFGALTLLGRDVQALAVSLVTRWHLDPDGHYTGLFIDAAAHLTDGRIVGLAALAAAYSVLRVGEAIGLWIGARWGEWLGVVTGALYLPVEAYELVHRATALKFGALVLNVAVVAYLVFRLRRQQTATEDDMATSDPSRRAAAG